MPDDGAENKPDTKTQNESNNKRGNKLNFTPAIRMFAEGGVAAGCLAYGGFLLNSHPKPLLFAWTWIWVGFCLAGDSGGLWLVNHRKRQTQHPMAGWIPGTCRWSIIVIASIACFVAIKIEKPEQPVQIPLPATHPRFKLIFLTADSPPVRVDLPIEYLDTTNGNPITNGFFIPMQSPTSSVVLRILVKNDTSNTTADDVFIAVGLLKSLKISSANGWKEAVFKEPFWNSKATDTNDLRFGAFSFPAILPKNGECLPDIVVNPEPPSPLNSILWILARAKDWPPMVSAFHLGFEPPFGTHMLLKPVVVPGTLMADGHLQYILPPYDTNAPK